MDKRELLDYQNRKRKARQERMDRDETDLDAHLEDGFSLMMDDDDLRDQNNGVSRLSGLADIPDNLTEL